MSKKPFIHNAEEKERSGLSNTLNQVRRALKTGPEACTSTSITSVIDHYRRKKTDGYFPLGSNARFLFSFLSFSMPHVDHNIERITGIKATKFQTQPLYKILSRIIVPEHARAFPRFLKLLFEYLSKYREQSVVINTEHNIYVPGKKIKRLLYQFRPVHWNEDGAPILLYGFITDFTHLQPGGSPRITMIRNGNVETTLNAEPMEMLDGIDLPLNHKELSVLKLKHQGFRTKEIAQTLLLKELTVYSIVRDIKRKTGMDILPLIQLLKENGILQD